MKISLSKSQWILLAIVAVVFVAHIFIIGQPFKSYVYDESFYVPAAKALLNGSVSNVEHPPLAKAAIAAGMLIFGDNGIGWRILTVLAGTLTIVLVYYLVLKLGGSEKTALIAAFLLGFENLWFTHSSIAMLDIIAVFFSTLGLLLFILDKKVWAGITLGLAILSKETVIFVVPIMLIYEVLQQKKIWSLSSWKVTKRFLITIVLPVFVVFTAGLWAYDAAYGAFPTPAQHIAKIFATQDVIESMNVSNVVSPLNWFISFKPEPYYVTTYKIDDVKYTTEQYRGQPNLLIIWLAWLSIPFAWSAVRKKKPLELLNVCLIIMLYAVFIVISLKRVTYPFYILQFIPSLAIINSIFLSKMPKSLLIAYCAGVLAWFVWAFPVNLF
jgi:predicted membrane-bound dolichyl-phosphate-mannose-protein mannosyltransferase